MSASEPDGRRLTELHELRRNRYYEGTLLTAADFTREQEYWLARERQLNSRVFGHGVVSGLGVTALRSGDTPGLRISPGLAIDGWGRLVVVPEEHEIVPVALTDKRGRPVERRKGTLPRRFVVSLCYRELRADPVVGPDDQAEAATWVETYAIRVRKGSAATDPTPRLDEVLDALRAGGLHDALCALGGAGDSPLPDDPSVVLANVSTATGGTLEVEQCAARRVVATNAALLALIAGLARHGQM
jgi:hypothetical protein